MKGLDTNRLVNMWWVAPSICQKKKFNMMHIKGEARFRQQKLKKVVCFLPSKRPIANNVKKINK